MNNHPVLDIERFWENFSELKHLLPSLMASFEKQCPHSLARIETAIQAGDANAMRTAAHAFKGVLFQIFATRSGKVAEELEQRGRAGSLDGAPELYTLLATEVDLLLNEIRTIDFSDSAA